MAGNPSGKRERFFAGIKKAAQELIAEETKEGGDPSQLDFSASSMDCCFCGKYTKFDSLPNREPYSCVKCKAPAYCSKNCAIADLSQPSVPGAPTHNESCLSMQQHMLRLPETRAILKQFPWGRLEKDGAFNEDIARARFNVLGSSNMGFWSQRAGPISHADERLPDGLAPALEARYAVLKEAYTHIDGVDLLQKRHLGDQDGWKLEMELIPFRTFSSLWTPPRLASKAKIVDWESWYKWRRLPLESPAALLMTFPMSVYWLLVHVLQVATPQAGNPDNRKELTVHMLGVECEMNYLPIFSELALLLPYHDIKLILFGHGIVTLAGMAKDAPGSLVSQASTTVPIFSYGAPEESGASKLSIFINTSSPYWTPADAIPDISPFKSKPDALVALNAGLAGYPEWRPAILWTIATKTPFGVTEYVERSCEVQRMHFPLLLNEQARREGSIYSGPGAPSSDECRRLYMQGAKYPIELNPFQNPGQRPVSWRLPNLQNGFTMRVA